MDRQHEIAEAYPLPVRQDFAAQKRILKIEVELANMFILKRQVLALNGLRIF
jgi:hypothetical protein